MLTAVRTALFAIFACATVQAGEPPLRLGTNVWPGYEPLYLARGLGHLDSTRVALIEYLSASEVIRAFRNRAIQAAALTLDEALLLVDGGLAVQVVLVTDVSNGGDAVLARPPVKRIEQLRGRRIGVESGALGAYVLSRALEIGGLDLAAVEIVHLPINEHRTAYQQGTVDALVSFEPVRSQLIASGAREVFSSRDIPGEIVDVVVVERHFRLEHPQLVEHLLNAWFKGLDHLHSHPSDAATRMSARLNLSPEAVLASFAGLQLPDRAENRAFLGGAKPKLRAVAERLQNVMIAHQLLGKRPITKDLFFATALEQH